mmetsp:Transcript_126225/g.247468  ORF Transcript_126225/g.247468 Transcript_126225/m.247468 type:complete len:543 (-) Transcript_126225:66-1694(-)
MDQAVEVGDVVAERITMDYQKSAACQQRCEKELARQVPAWKMVTIPQVMENHAKVAPGMFYGLEFPWTEQRLIDMGPAWLTKAFRAAGTLDDDNEVVSIIPEQKVKVTTGNNGGKFLFEVRYMRGAQGLHTKLFAKIPHPCEGVTQSDRLSTSVNKQPMELYELNANRLLEATLPVKIPKYYFGDISNETSNWILITERIPFADREPLDFAGRLVQQGRRRGPLAPYVVEGPYDKCLDWTLRGPPSEYYLALVRCGARMAGLHRAGKMGDPAALAQHFEDWSNKPIEVFGCKPAECSGARPKEQKMKIDLALKFMSEDGKAIFPSFCSDSAFKSKLERTLLTFNAYSAESLYWRHSNQDYIALTHNNMNVDNAFFWRDEDGNLDLGVLDWGSMGQRSLGFKLWWWLYCCEFDVLTGSIDALLDCFVSTYAEFGGPTLDKNVLRTQFVLTALEQMLGLCAAVPQIYKMCKKPEWKTITDRYDDRIGKNIDGKSTLRLYLQVMATISGIIHDLRWKGDEVLSQWVETLCSAHGMPKKGDNVIFQ